MSSVKLRKYPIAPNGIFWSIQGEAHLRGVQMAFIRLAGCSVGCIECDTDYSVNSRLSIQEIKETLQVCVPPGTTNPWVWITGGEPTDHDLNLLIWALKASGYKVAIATSGYKVVTPPVDWLSVSPHEVGRCSQRFGHELKLVYGLGAIQTFSDLERAMKEGDSMDFWFRYVQPLSEYDSQSDQFKPSQYHLDDCLTLLERNPEWSLSMQEHHLIRVK